MDSTDTNQNARKSASWPNVESTTTMWLVFLRLALDLRQKRPSGSGQVLVTVKMSHVIIAYQSQDFTNSDAPQEKLSVQNFRKLDPRSEPKLTFHNKATCFRSFHSKTFAALWLSNDIKSKSLIWLTPAMRVLAKRNITLNLYYASRSIKVDTKPIIH